MKLLHDAPTGDWMESYVAAVATLFTEQGFEVREVGEQLSLAEDVPVSGVLDADMEGSDLRVICFEAVPGRQDVELVLQEAVRSVEVRSLVVFMPDELSSEEGSRMEELVDGYGASVSFFSLGVEDDGDDMPDEMPSSYEVIGDVAVLSADDLADPEAVAEGIMKQNPNVETVLRKTGQLSGEFRVGDYEVVVGDETETVHTEHGCRYRIDPTEVYFSERLSHERERVVSLIEEGEYVHVWFAGVGPYAIMAARNADPSRVDAIEKNPAGCDYMEDNIELNKVGGVVDGFCGDVRDIVPDLPRPNRIVMPLPKSADEFLELAMERVAPGGVIHYYRFSEDEVRWEQPEDEVAAVAGEVGREYEVVGRTVCGHYAPYIHRVCLDIKVS